MAPAPRTFQHAAPSAVLLAALSHAAVAWATPASRPTVTPAPRVDLGAPDPRCSDLAYPLWDDGMCVRAKCADDDACDFSKVAGAQPPPAPAGLAQERWRMATAQPAGGLTSHAAPFQLAGASRRDAYARRTADIPLLAEARAVSPPLGKLDQTAPRNAATAILAEARAVESRAKAVNRKAQYTAARAGERPSLWDRIRAALVRLWRRIQGLSRLLAPTKHAAMTKGTS